MSEQLNLNINFGVSESAPKPVADGSARRDRGIRRAAEHAEEVHENWQGRALEYLQAYARTHQRFSGEMVRIESRGVVPDPPSLRAWGAVLVGAVKRGWIKEVGYIRVNNPRAHRTPATLWESRLYLKNRSCEDEKL